MIKPEKATHEVSIRVLLNLQDLRVYDSTLLCRNLIYLVPISKLYTKCQRAQADQAKTQTF